jgi:anaerobic magnesium-protoporphyrin IX monomethyl ester cyclase
MRILLINVCIRYNTIIKYIPVGLSCIATALDHAGFHPDIYDIDLHEYNDDEIKNFLRKNNNYDIVGFGNIVSGYKFTKKIAIQVKEAMPKTLIVVGNTVATSITEILLTCVPQIDIAVLGEGDRTIVDIAKAVASGKEWRNVAGIAYRSESKIIFSSQREAIPKITDVDFPDYSLFDINMYLSLSYKTISEPIPPIPIERLRALPINTARGCLFNCTFCGHAFKGYRYRYYPFNMVVNFIKELQENYSINYVHFWDELTFFSRKRLEELCQIIEKSKIFFYWKINCRPNTFTWKDLDLLKRAKDLGAMAIGGAFESADNDILKAMNKKMEIEQYVKQVQVARKAGLEVATSLVFGYPQETKETIIKTIDLCRQLSIYPSAGFLLPLPKTSIYDYVLQKGLIADEEDYLLSIGDRQDLHINLTKMTDEELIDTLRQELIKLKNDLGIPIADDNVLKTTTYKVARK